MWHNLTESRRRSCGPLFELDGGPTTVSQFFQHDAKKFGGILPPPVLMFMNMKGGVGKTTLAVELSRTLAHAYDKHVLLIDYDPQANASLAFFDPGAYFRLLREGKSVANCLMPSRQETDPFSVIGTIPSNSVDSRAFSVKVRGWYYPENREKKAGRLDLIPGNLELMRLALNVLTFRYRK